MKNKKRKKWIVTLGYSVFDGNKKIEEVIVKKRMSKVDLKALDLARMIYETK